MDHPDEIINLILKKYSQRYTDAHLHFQYQQMLPLIQPKLVEMGYMHEGRWRHIADTYSELGLLPTHFSLNGFIYEKNPRPNLTIFYWSIALLSSALLLFWGLSAQRARLNKHLRTEITLEIEKNQQQKHDFIVKLEQANKLLEQQVIIRTSVLNNTLEKLKNLLNNSGEGFLAFNQQMIIDAGYSEECKKIFSTEIAEKNINELLFPTDVTQQSNFKKNMQRILQEEDEFKQSLFLSLLPSQLNIRDKIIAIHYKPLNSHSMMMKMVDITEAETLKQALIDERKHLLFIVEVILEPKEFFTLSEDYQYFIHQGYKTGLAENNSVTEKIMQLYREIHTFKGIFLQKYLLHTPHVLHSLELDLAALKHQAHYTSQELIALVDSYHLSDYFKQDLSYLHNALGKNYFTKKDCISISELALKDSIAYAKQLTKEQNVSDKNMAELIKKMQHLRFVDIKVLLGHYAKTVQQLSKRLNKSINALTIEGDSIFIDPDEYHGFIKSLIHVFRNMVDHGIETPEQREELNKPEFGTITCHVQQLAQDIQITLSDDGAGIDIDKLKAQALALGLYKEQQLQQWSKPQSLMLIFEQQLSTANKIDLISGQGVGLAAVYAELKKRQGNVIVHSSLHQGTTFIFTLPLPYL